MSRNRKLQVTQNIFFCQAKEILEEIKYALIKDIYDKMVLGMRYLRLNCRVEEFTSRKRKNQ